MNTPKGTPYHLSEESIRWSIRHIERFGDTDLLPVPVEYRAIAFDCDKVSKSISEIDLIQHISKVPRRLAVPKAIGGFRIGSQLDPVDTLLFTALANTVAPQIEAARIPVDQKVSCSYRVEIKENGQFFAPGFGSDCFNETTANLLTKSENRFVLTVDLADFYSQISHHRIANNMELAGLSTQQFCATEHLLNQLASNHHSRRAYASKPLW